MLVWTEASWEEALKAFSKGRQVLVQWMGIQARIGHGAVTLRIGQGPRCLQLVWAAEHFTVKELKRALEEWDMRGETGLYAIEVGMFVEEFLREAGKSRKL